MLWTVCPCIHKNRVEITCLHDLLISLNDIIFLTIKLVYIVKFYKKIQIVWSKKKRWHISGSTAYTEFPKSLAHLYISYMRKLWKLDKTSWTYSNSYRSCTDPDLQTGSNQNFPINSSLKAGLWIRVQVESIFYRRIRIRSVKALIFYIAYPWFLLKKNQFSGCYAWKKHQNLNFSKILKPKSSFMIIF